MFNGCTDCPRVNTERSGWGCRCHCAVLPVYECRPVRPSTVLNRTMVRFIPFVFSSFREPHTGVCGDRYIQRSTKFSACVPGKSFSFNIFSGIRYAYLVRAPVARPRHARRRPVGPCARCGPNAEANRVVCVILNACTVFRQTPPCLACALASHAWGRRCSDDDAMTSIRSPQFAIDTGPDQRMRTIRPSECVLRGLTASATWSKDRVRCTWLRKRCEATLNRRSASLCPFGATIVGT